MLHIAKPRAEAAMKALLLKRSDPRKSQAVSELAIFGSLIIVAFAGVLSYLQSTNSQQALQMRAFRRAIQLSRYFGQEITYTIVRDSPVFDISDPFGRPDTSRQTVSSTVAAVREDPFSADPAEIEDRASREFYNVNGRETEVYPIKVDMEYTKPDGSSPHTVSAWVSAPIADVEYQTQKQRRGLLSRTEGGSSILSTRTGSVTTQGATNLILEDKTTFQNNYRDSLNDKVEEEPWEKQLKNDAQLADLESFLTWLAGTLRYSYGGYCGTGEAVTLKSVLLAAGSYAVSVILSYYLKGSNDLAQSVDVSSGYRPRDSLNQASSFSAPEQNFNVSQ